jgi:hypothetical protein
MTARCALALVVMTLLAVLPACKGSSREGQAKDPGTGSASAALGSAAAPPVDAQIADANVDACRAAAATVATLPRNKRTVALLEGCAPCGDWGPILGWSITEADGGPRRAAIEASLRACNAFCDDNAQQRFFGTFDSARGQNGRTPWRLLGEICKAAVSAVPDTRYMGAPYFALDRAARLIGDPALLAAIELPLPAVGITGAGVELPGSPLMVPEAGPTSITVNDRELVLGTLPSAKLSTGGVVVAGDYPGTAVAPEALAAALARPERSGHPAALLAPRELPASRIVDAVTAARGREIRLAVGERQLLGWVIPNTVPVALLARAPGRPGAKFTLDASGFEALKAVKATPREELVRAPVTIAVDPSATATGLATLLGTLGFSDVKSVVLVKAPAAPAAAAPTAPAAPADPAKAPTPAPPAPAKP